MKKIYLIKYIFDWCEDVENTENFAYLYKEAAEAALNELMSVKELKIKKAWITEMKLWELPY